MKPSKKRRTLRRAKERESNKARLENMNALAEAIRKLDKVVRRRGDTVYK
jgi:hypothetical protein